MERSLQVALFMFSFSLTSSALARDLGPLRTIYGEDARTEAHEEGDALMREASRSVAGLVLDQDLVAEGEVHVPRDLGTLGESKRLCSPKIRYYSQKVLAQCTGFLVSEDLLVTAGHCVRPFGRLACPYQAWVFDFVLGKGQSTPPKSFSKDQVYRCSEVLSYVEEEGEGADYAIVKLDRPVEGRRPLTMAAGPRVEAGKELAIIGHPNGIPLKISRGAKVFRDMGSYFTANLDSFHGNSGSPVLDARSGEVQGILVRGNADFAWTAQGCRVLNVCSEDGASCTAPSDLDMEHSTKISLVREELRKLGY